MEASKVTMQGFSGPGIIIIISMMPGILPGIMDMMMMMPGLLSSMDARCMPYDAWPTSEFPQCPLRLACTAHGSDLCAEFPQCPVEIPMDAWPRQFHASMHELNLLSHWKEML
jgi:hypothetical protein